MRVDILFTDNKTTTYSYGIGKVVISHISIGSVFSLKTGRIYGSRGKIVEFLICNMELFIRRVDMPSYMCGNAYNGYHRVEMERLSDGFDQVIVFSEKSSSHRERVCGIIRTINTVIDFVSRLGMTYHVAIIFFGSPSGKLW